MLLAVGALECCLTHRFVGNTCHLSSSWWMLLCVFSMFFQVSRFDRYSLPSFLPVLPFFLFQLDRIRPVIYLDTSYTGPVSSVDITVTFFRRPTIRTLSKWRSQLWKDLVSTTVWNITRSFQKFVGFGFRGCLCFWVESVLEVNRDSWQVYDCLFLPKKGCTRSCRAIAVLLKECAVRFPTSLGKLKCKPLNSRPW